MLSIFGDSCLFCFLISPKFKFSVLEYLSADEIKATDLTLKDGL